jgi:hypothetical protein
VIVIHTSAYGIRNSFGMDFDPVTGKLWDTENGPTFGDEINLVNPGFNSGWIKIQGLANGDGGDGRIGNPAKGLVSFGGKGVYRDPEFVWSQPIGPTALKFLNSAKLGSQYQNDMFTGDVNTGNLYHFKFNPTRDGLRLSGSLADKAANTPEESQQAALGHGFGTITDLQVGPDGYLYILTFAGGLYRIVPASSSSSSIYSPPDGSGISNNDRNTEAADSGSGGGGSSSTGNSSPGVLHGTNTNDNNNNSNNDNTANNHHTKKANSGISGKHVNEIESSSIVGGLVK